MKWLVRTSFGQKIRKKKNMRKKRKEASIKLKKCFAQEIVKQLRPTNEILSAREKEKKRKKRKEGKKEERKKKNKEK